MHNETTVLSNLNRALHAHMERDPDLWILGEDIADPYGGAFKVTRGLSSRFAGRVVSTPISEAGIVGLANGLAMSGGKAIVEIMFGDFLTLAFDQILNGAAKIRSLVDADLGVVVRAPVGGGRGYGPTHSQSPQKHFIGIPNVHLYQLSQFHDADRLLSEMLGSGNPCILFEDKRIYAAPMKMERLVDGLFHSQRLGGPTGPVRLRLDVRDPAAPADRALICSGAMAGLCMEAAVETFKSRELVTDVIVCARLYPLEVTSVLPVLREVPLIATVEEGTAGGTWGAETALAFTRELWGSLAAPIRTVHSEDRSIPAAVHLERDVLVQVDDILKALTE